MINKIKHRSYDLYRDLDKKHHREIQNSHLYARLSELFRDFDAQTDHVNELTQYIMSANIEWNESLDKRDYIIENYLSDERLRPYYPILSTLLFDLSSKFKMAELDMVLPSTAIDSETNELELYWNTEKFRLLIQIEIDTTEVNGILYYVTHHKTYCFEMDTDIENIANQIVAVIKSTQ